METCCIAVAQQFSDFIHGKICRLDELQRVMFADIGKDILVRSPFRG
jgi:hypothetical protein